MKEVLTIGDAAAHFQNSTEPVKCRARATSSQVCVSLAEAEAYFDLMSKPASNTNQIILFLHCGLCVKEKPRGISPRDWSQLEVGWTPHGIQVWCRRHECNVCHVDFQGQQHPANLSIYQRPDLGL